jgi:hypothetical protein
MKALLLSLTLLLALVAATPVQPNNVPADTIQGTGGPYLICRSPNAYAYHAYRCRGLANCNHRIDTVSVAPRNFRPCGICFR